MFKLMGDIMNKMAIYIHGLQTADEVKDALEIFLKKCSDTASNVMIDAGIPEENVVSQRVISAIDEVRYYGPTKLPQKNR